MKNIRALLEEASQQSTCHFIHLGVVIETPQSEYVLGWNGPPVRVGTHTECLVGEFTLKNLLLCPAVHAEVRAICRAAEAGIAIAGGTLYLSHWFCCTPCAVAMIEAGISKFVLTEKISYANDDCYNFRLAEELLKKARVTIEINPALRIEPSGYRKGVEPR